MVCVAPPQVEISTGNDGETGLRVRSDPFTTPDLDGGGVVGAGNIWPWRIAPFTPHTPQGPQNALRRHRLHTHRPEHLPHRTLRTDTFTSNGPWKTVGHGCYGNLSGAVTANTDVT